MDIFSQGTEKLFQTKVPTLNNSCPKGITGSLFYRLSGVPIEKDVVLGNLFGIKNKQDLVCPLVLKIYLDISSELRFFDIFSKYFVGVVPL